MKNILSKTFRFSCCALLLCFCYACSTSKKLTYYEFPKPIDTKEKAINYQTKKTYSFSEMGVYVSNEFDGARLNDCKMVDEHTIIATMSPENTPINASAYYAMQIWSDEAKTIQVILNYTEHKHRYLPKTSTNRKDWTWVDSTQFVVSPDEKQCTVTLPVSPTKTYLAAQELVTSTDVKAWCEALAKDDIYTIGKSKLGRDIDALQLGDFGKLKDAIVIMSRQHPPEVSGFFAMQAFVEEIMADTPLSKAFREKYVILVYPLINPDGVDLGHWRHSAGGIDLNRDWAFYHQPETRAVADDILGTTKAHNINVILGIDFHSTWHDVYYTMVDSLRSDIPKFKDYWLDGIEHRIEGYEVNEKPSGLRTPVSKGWFYAQFNAEGITYEIGDETDRDFIKLKGKVSAQEMMKLLVFKDSESRREMNVKHAEGGQ